MLRSVGSLPGSVEASAVEHTDRKRFSAWLESLNSFDIFIPNVSALSADWDASVQTDISATVGATEEAVPFLLRSSHAAITYIWF